MSSSSRQRKSTDQRHCTYQTSFIIRDYALNVQRVDWHIIERVHEKTDAFIKFGSFKTEFVMCQVNKVKLMTTATKWNI